MRFEDQQIARELRREGWTLPEIGKEVKAGKGLVSLWVRGVAIRENGASRLTVRKVGMLSARSARTWKSPKCKARRDVSREAGRGAARKGEILHALACGLYWGEGSKSTNTAQIINTDVNILRIFVKFCRTYFGVKNHEMSIRISGYTSVHSEQEMVSYWLKALDLDGASQRKNDLDNMKYASRGHNKAKIGKHPYGSCTITVSKSTPIIQHIYGAIEAYGGTVFDPHAAPRRPQKSRARQSSPVG